MTWVIGDDVDGVILPFGGPQTLNRRVMRKQTADKILEDFPIPFDLGPDSFEMVMTGLISPAAEADKLWEICKRAEQESIQIVVLNEAEFAKFTGLYAVSKGDISISGPMFDENGKSVQKYAITFVQFAEQGDLGNGDSGDSVGTEPGIGFGDIDISFGDIVFDTFGNLFPNLLG